MIRTEDGILFGQRIFKNKDYSIEEDSVHHRPDIEFEDITIEFRMFVEDIIAWEEYKATDLQPKYKYTGPLVVITTTDAPIIALCTIAELDTIVVEYRRSLTLQFKHN